MLNEMSVLMMTALSLAFLHTSLGPDHYLPFIVMAKSRKWSYRKTMLITFLCGMGHVASSLALGLLGIGLGLAAEKLEFFESVRGGWAAWALIAFGLVYFIYGIRRAIKNKPHVHIHFHKNGNAHSHRHTHFGEHSHVHEQSMLSQPIPWALFVIFILGPCEPLIPLLMYPAAQGSLWGAVLVASVFCAVTVITMMGIVSVGSFGLNILPLRKVEKYGHALAGLAIFLCGCAIEFLGL